MHGWLVLIELHGAWFLEVVQHQLVLLVCGDVMDVQWIWKFAWNSHSTFCQIKMYWRLKLMISQATGPLMRKHIADILSGNDTSNHFAIFLNMDHLPSISCERTSPVIGVRTGVLLMQIRNQCVRLCPSLAPYYGLLYSKQCHRLGHRHSIW